MTVITNHNSFNAMLKKMWVKGQECAEHLDNLRGLRTYRRGKYRCKDCGGVVKD